MQTANNHTEPEKLLIDIRYALLNTALFLISSVLFLFINLATIHINEYHAENLNGIELLSGKEILSTYGTLQLESSKPAWLFLVCLVAGFVFSFTGPKTAYAYLVISSTAALIFLINSDPTINEIDPQAKITHTATYYVIMGLLFLNASMAYIRSINGKPAEIRSTTSTNQIHINIFSEKPPSKNK